MPVFRALLYLRLMSLRNMLRSQLRRLRQPKYLVGAIAGAAYFWFFFIRPGKTGGPSRIFESAGNSGHIELIAFIVLTFFLALIWITPSENPGIAFSEAEVAFLFPAPLARRQLIHYKLLNGLLMSLVGSIFFTLVAGGLHLGWVEALRKLGAWWSLNANLTLHQTAAALTIARLSRYGVRAGLRRILIIIGLVLLSITVYLLSVKTGTASLSWLLWPARLAVGPLLASNLNQYLLALCPAVGLVALHYFWCHRLEAPFEEASLALAQKRGETLARLRSGKGVRFGGSTKARRNPFRLGNRLPPELAFLWKNLLAAPSYLNRKAFLGAAAVIYFGLTWLKQRPDFDGSKIAGAVAVISLVLLAYLLIFGPQIARNDLRGDIPNADILKAYPLPGWRMVLGGLLAPVVILTGIAWLFLLCAGLALPSPSGDWARWFTPQCKIAGALSLATVMPALCAVQLLVPNAAALLFPAWSQNSRSFGGGVDAMGQRLIFFFGQMVCLAVALLPAFALGGATIFLTQWLIGLPTAIALATLPVLAVFVGEIWLGVWILGQRFEKLDLSSELRP